MGEIKIPQIPAYRKLVDHGYSFDEFIKDVLSGFTQSDLSFKYCMRLDEVVDLRNIVYENRRSLLRPPFKGSPTAHLRKYTWEELLVTDVFQLRQEGYWPKQYDWKDLKKDIQQLSI